MAINSVNEICESIINKVTTSCLDFHMNQTPYSLHFSIRKKFSRNLTPNFITTSSTEAEVDLLRQALLNTTNEYQKLLAMYQTEPEAKHYFENECNNLREKLAETEKTETNIKALKKDNKSLSDKLENKSLDLNHLRSELESAKKEKNTLSVALKTSIADSKNKNKEFEKKQKELEKEFAKLILFKNLKLEEEREEKLAKRKELKKAKQSKKKELIVHQEKVKVEFIEEKSIENDTVTVTEVDVKEEVDKSIGKEELTLESDDSLTKINSGLRYECDVEHFILR